MSLINVVDVSVLQDVHTMLSMPCLEGIYLIASSCFKSQYAETVELLAIMSVELSSNGWIGKSIPFQLQFMM